MADATKLPTASELQFFYWADKPKLTVGLIDDPDDNTLYWSTPPRNRAGAIIDGGFILGATNKAGKTERIFVPVGAVSDDGLSAVGCERGIDPNGLDYTDGDEDFILTVDGGSPLTCVIAAQAGELLRAAISGLIATGGTGIILGTDADGTVTLYRSTGVGTYVGFLRWNTSNDKTEYSNDGSAWNTFDSVTASNLVVVTNSDTTPGTLQNKTASGTGITRTVLNPGGNEQLQFSVNGTLADLISDVTTTATEINQALDGISANVTAANLNTLTAGPTSDASALHTHIGITKFGGTGSDGALAVSTDTVLNPTYKVFNYTDLTIDAAKVLSFGANFQNKLIYIKVSGNCVINGTLSLKGAGGSGGAGGAGGGGAGGVNGTTGLAINSDVLDALEHRGLLGTGSTGAGATTGGAAGAALTRTGIGAVYATQIKNVKYVIPAVGGGGGGGGYGSAGTGGAGGAAGSITALPTSGSVGSDANTGGGGGGAGGGGAGGGGLILEVAGNLTIGAAGVIDLSGQNGANGANGGRAFVSGHGGSGGGGGGGGCGGMGLILYNGTLSNSGSISVTGGNGGSSGASGIGVSGAGGSTGGAGGGGAGENAAGGAGAGMGSAGSAGTAGSAGAAGGGASGGGGFAGGPAAGASGGAGSATGGFYLLEKNVQFA